MPRKTSSKSKKLAKIADEKHVGSEITDWSNYSEVDQITLAHQFKHYNYYYTSKEGHIWVLDWAKENKPKVLKKLKKAEQWRFGITLCAICRMLNNGAPLGEPVTKHVHNWIDKIIISVEEKKEEKSDAPNVQSKSPAEIVAEKTSDMIARIEEYIDKDDYTKSVHDELMKMNWYDEFTKDDVPYNLVKGVYDYYTPIQRELDTLVNGNDKELEEGYSTMKPLQRKRALALVNHILNECDNYMNKKKAKRKPRAKKAPKVENQIKGLKYLDESKEFKITSINPINIVGAKTLLLFNTRYKSIAMLLAKDDKGFEVRGTSIYNIDEDASYKKTVRKPEEFLPQIQSVTKARAVKLISSLKTKQQGVTGRVNEQTVLLKTFT